MRKIILILVIIVLSLSNTMFSQEVYSPRGCSASTGPNVSKTVLEHPECRYQLVVSRWAEIELSQEVFTFTSLKAKINLVKSYNKKYSLAITMGGTGSPSWLINSMNVPYLDYKFRWSTPSKLPLWWDSTLLSRIELMVDTLGKEFENDTSLALVYITQMTANGNEGHLQGVNMDSMRLKGFTAERWISSAKQTAKYFADAFPTKSLAYEVHDIENSSVIPITIINELYNDSHFKNRIGVALWWLSGKTTYQKSLLDFIKTFPGEKYAQIIAHSGQPDRFADSTIATAFEQAKELNVRYIEPWYEEYKNRTIDSILHDFNCWVDSCNNQTSVEYIKFKDDSFQISSNPASEYIEINFERWSPPSRWTPSEIKIFNTFGECVMTEPIHPMTSSHRMNLKQLPAGLYLIQIGNYMEKFVVVK